MMSSSRRDGMAPGTMEVSSRPLSPARRLLLSAGVAVAVSRSEFISRMELRVRPSLNGAGVAGGCQGDPLFHLEPR